MGIDTLYKLFVNSNGILSRQEINNELKKNAITPKIKKNKQNSSGFNEYSRPRNQQNDNQRNHNINQSNTTQNSQIQNGGPNRSNHRVTQVMETPIITITLLQSCAESQIVHISFPLLSCRKSRLLSCRMFKNRLPRLDPRWLRIPVRLTTLPEQKNLYQPALDTDKKRWIAEKLLD